MLLGEQGSTGAGACAAQEKGWDGNMGQHRPTSMPGQMAALLTALQRGHPLDATLWLHRSISKSIAKKIDYKHGSAEPPKEGAACLPGANQERTWPLCMPRTAGIRPARA